MNFIKFNVGRILLFLGIFFLIGDGYAIERRSFQIIKVNKERSQTKAINPTVQETKDKMPKQKSDYCNTDADCSSPTCINCGSVCVQNRCTYVHCKEHGTYDFGTGKCFCKKGYHGKYCEKENKSHKK